ncbi:MAG: hypothetical protein SAL70_44300 [Scytonema sp. PMC 1070.18]|nr:hypothetical protein [Scytonema sp. PMC 1070.18]
MLGGYAKVKLVGAIASSGVSHRSPLNEALSNFTDSHVFNKCDRPYSCTYCYSTILVIADAQFTKTT